MGKCYKIQKDLKTTTRTDFMCALIIRKVNQVVLKLYTYNENTQLAQVFGNHNHDSTKHASMDVVKAMLSNAAANPDIPTRKIFCSYLIVNIIFKHKIVITKLSLSSLTFNI